MGSIPTVGGTWLKSSLGKGRTQLVGGGGRLALTFQPGYGLLGLHVGASFVPCNMGTIPNPGSGWELSAGLKDGVDTIY